MTRCGVGNRAVAVLVAVLTCALVTAGCAAIPTESQPRAVPQQNAGQPTQEIPEPQANLDPLSVVREFVRNGAQTANDHAASRAYLATRIQESWKPGSSVTVIRDDFGTVYAPEAEQPKDPNQRVVALRATVLGRLASDNSFIADEQKSIRKPVRLQRQSDGEWRIVEPPDNIMITESDFSEAYRQVPVYFFAPDAPALVPDVRYVVARPQSGLPARVIDLLLSGPSDGLAGAVRNPLEDTTLDSNVTTNSDGSLVVPLTGLGDESEQDRKSMAAQIVRSLQHVTTNRVKLLSDGAPLVPGQPERRPSDLPAYDTVSSPSSELPGLLTLNGRVHSLGNGAPINGPAGDGTYDVVSAAQPINGQQLAVVERVGEGVRLRVGGYGGPTQVVDQQAKTMTRPTWRPPVTSDDKSTEVWTVVDGRQVIRVQQNPAGRWVTQRVNAFDLPDEGAITGLRLSRDGTRAALIVDRQLVVASVVRSPTEVTLRAPRVLQEGRMDSVVDVDWLDQDTLVVALTSERFPVVRVSVDGFRLDQYNSSNLMQPIRAITAAPGRPIVVADRNGLWTVSEIGAVWRPHQQSSPNAVPFYPG